MRLASAGASVFSEPPPDWVASNLTLELGLLSIIRRRVSPIRPKSRSRSACCVAKTGRTNLVVMSAGPASGVVSFAAPDSPQMAASAFEMSSRAGQLVSGHKWLRSGEYRRRSPEAIAEFERPGLCLFRKNPNLVCHFGA